jgi:hypothetical protein
MFFNLFSRIRERFSSCNCNSNTLLSKFKERIVYNKTGNARINVILKIALATIVAVEEQ